ncbi:Beta-galactosidase [Lunatimonas lonarensis]|uniref:Beta-galactosidase n=2 Tax=Lunatimonas lonarensis TaxID=1232681 RepID=R7ZTY7_9BACT|nr:Beta-galactosidase [Lunatimonas lonarensis]
MGMYRDIDLESRSRREFIRAGAVFLGGMWLFPTLPTFGSAKEISLRTEVPWFKLPLRIMHTVLRETDVQDYDVDIVTNYVLKSGANVLCVNAGGITDFWQNPLPAANLNPFLKGRDILKDISEACKAKGIRVIGRVDFRGVVPEVYEKFPDWFAKNRDQRPMMMTYTKPHLHIACYNTPYRNDYANEYIGRVLQAYDLDGIWHNSPGYDGICYCPYCQEAYKAYNGRTIPVMGESSTEELDAYMGWKRYAADAYMDKIKRTIKSYGEDKVYTAEVFSMYEVGRRVNNGIDLKNAFDHFDILVSVAFLTENAENIHYEDYNYAQSIIKFLKSAAPEREAVVMYGGNGTSHRLVIEPSLDVKIWLWEILAVGGRFWNCYFTNVPTIAYDTRNAFVEEDANHFVREHAELLAGHVPVSRIGIYYSRPTRLHYRNELLEEEQFGEAIKGMEAVLIESHIPHDFILSEQVSADKLKAYHLVILPNVHCMAEAEVKLLTDYVNGGGNLLATYATSLLDQEGNPRKDFALSQLFGVNYGGERWNTRKDNYQFISAPEHPLVAEDAVKTQLLHQYAYTLKTMPLSSAKVICHAVPTVHNQPPDKAWVERLASEHPTIVEHAFGKGKVIYFANQPDVTTHQMGHGDARNVLARAVNYLVGEENLPKSNAPSSVHMGWTRSIETPGKYVFSLVNTSSGPKRPTRELISVHQLSFRLPLPGQQLISHKILKNQGSIHVVGEPGFVTIEIEKLEDFVAVYLEAEYV